MTVGPSCSAGEFPFKDSCCAGCPKGEFVQSPCQSSKATICQQCSHGHFTDNINFLFKCRPCRFCHSNGHMVLMGECKANQDRQCKCEEGYYCDGLSCDHCRPVSVCPTGSGVSTPSNGRMDTICKPCPEGKYNNVVDSKTPCLTHTECEVLGRPGTEVSDAVCAREQSCHWVLPACLWAGLVLTLLIIGFGYFFWRKKHRSKKTVTKHEMPMNDVTLKLPNLIPEGYTESCNGESHALCCNRQPCDSNFPSTVMFSSCQVEVHHPMKSVDLECDGPGTPTLTSSEHFDQSAARRGEAQSFTPSPCQSQPQEDEWSGT